MDIGTRSPQRSCLVGRALAVIAVLGMLLAGGGCSITGDSDGSGDGRDLADIVRDALEEAKERQRQRSGDTSGDSQPGGAIGTDGRTEFGIAGLAMARTVSGARLYLIGGGAVYLVLWLYGLVIDHDSAANFVPVNGPDNWLHLFLGLGMIALGLITTRRPASAR